ncbi:MAG: pilus assembly protein CpaF [Thermoleophilia bacterium]|nr:pilus assembly protein CpaF [Thermoleophilia bacterium]
MSLQQRLQTLQADTSNASTTGATSSTMGSHAGHDDGDEANDPFVELKTKVHKAVIHKVGPALFRSERQQPGNAESAREEMVEAVNEAVASIIEGDSTPLTRLERAQLISEITDDILGYGPIDPFLRDETVTEVMVNDHRTVYIERKGKITLTNARFVDEQHLERIIDKIVSQIGRRIDESSPMVDARLPDGSRVNAIIPPLAVRGSALTIRKFRKDPLKMEDLIKFGTLSPKAGQFLELCVKGALNVVISGGTGSGKTTTLNVLSGAIPPDARIITVEDAAELQLKQEHVITLESRPANIEGKGQVAIRDLVRNTLRMRPDRIVVGECRGPETVDMLQAMNTGHDGSMTTIHANNPREALSRVETLVLTAGVDLPLRAIREQAAGAIDLIVQVSRLVDGSRRITHITEVGKMEGETITLQDIFIAKPDDEGAERGATSRLIGPLTMTGIKPGFLDKLAQNGVTIPVSFFSGEEDLRGSANGSFGAGGSIRRAG